MIRKETRKRKRKKIRIVKRKAKIRNIRGTIGQEVSLKIHALLLLIAILFAIKGQEVVPKTALVSMKKKIIREKMKATQKHMNIIATMTVWIEKTGTTSKIDVIITKEMTETVEEKETITVEDTTGQGLIQGKEPDIHQNTTHIIEMIGMIIEGKMNEGKMIVRTEDLILEI